jgi:hypothetical protein
MNWIPALDGLPAWAVVLSLLFWYLAWMLVCGFFAQAWRTPQKGGRP